MVTHYDLRQKYKKWAHRRDGARKHRRKSRRRKKKRKAQGAGTTTEGMLLLLLQQLMMGIVTPAKKHGENVKTGYVGAVTPDALAPVQPDGAPLAQRTTRCRTRGWNRGGRGRRSTGSPRLPPE